MIFWALLEALGIGIGLLLAVLGKPDAAALLLLMGIYANMKGGELE